MNDKLIKVNLSKIDNFKEHPFLVNNDSSLMELVKSIKENGSTGYYYNDGYLDNCNYLMENIGYYEKGFDGTESYGPGYWLETPVQNSSDQVFWVSGLGRSIQEDYVDSTNSVRPVITVLKSDISY